ncbi:MAG: beta-lactamase family protein [Trueperaceae bacterium]|nr:beta-lactamase family protein [Trueperaceae bacterium]
MHFTTLSHPRKLFVQLVFLALSFLIGSLTKAQTVNVNSSLAKQLQERLDTSVDSSGAAGAVLFIQSPSFTWIGSSGFADLEQKRSMSTDDALRLASMTKTFVSVTVLKLAEEGKIALDDPVTKYLSTPAVSAIPNSSEISIRHLLAMTSGVFDYTDSDDYNDAIETFPERRPWKAEEVLAYIPLENALFLPGEGWSYSNSNYVLLDLLVKEVSGTSLASEIRRIIIDPLDLQHSFMEIQEPRPGGFGGLKVRGYEEGEDVTEIQDALGLGDGGLISTAYEVSQFLKALFTDKSLINDEMLLEMRKFHPQEDYGLGLERRETQFGTAWGHSGASSGFQGDMLYFPEKDFIFVLLSNTMDTDLCDIIFSETMDLINANE